MEHNGCCSSSGLQIFGSRFEEIIKCKEKDGPAEPAPKKLKIAVGCEMMKMDDATKGCSAVGLSAFPPNNACYCCSAIFFHEVKSRNNWDGRNIFQFAIQIAFPGFSLLFLIG